MQAIFFNPLKYGVIVYMLFFSFVPIFAQNSIQSEDITSNEVNDLKNRINVLEQENLKKQNNDNGMLATQVVLAIITGLMAIIAWRGNVSSNKLTSIDLKTRIRPILTRVGDTSIPLVYSADTRIGWDFKNVGQLPVSKALATWKIYIMENGEAKHIKKSEEFDPNGQKIAPLAPNESYALGLRYDDIHLQEISGGNNCFLEYDITYFEPSCKKPYKYKIVGNFKNRRLVLLPESEFT